MITMASTASTVIALSTLKKNLSFFVAKILETKSSLDHRKLKLKRANSRVCKSNRPLLEFVASSMLKLRRIFDVLRERERGKRVRDRVLREIEGGETEMELKERGEGDMGFERD
ncbi:hypothetical protein AMTRI_Chr06g195180 [Amborella trichopoda]